MGHACADDAMSDFFGDLRLMCWTVGLESLDVKEQILEGEKWVPLFGECIKY